MKRPPLAIKRYRSEKKQKTNKRQTNKQTIAKRLKHGNFFFDLVRFFCEKKIAPEAAFIFLNFIQVSSQFAVFNKEREK